MQPDVAGSEPEAMRWSADNCTVGRAMEILGEKWTVVVLREIFSGVRRFDHIQQRSRIPRQVLADRLAMLVTRGILRRESYRDPGSRTRYEYRLTEMGFDIYPVLLALLEWGDRYLADPEGSPLTLVHGGCGEPARTHIVCDGGHDIASLRDIVPQPGPGAHRRDERLVSPRPSGRSRAPAKHSG